MESLTAGLVSSKETTTLNGGTETEQTKNIMFLQFTSRRGLHTNDHGPDLLGGYMQQKYPVS